ncbi:COBRA-like protein 10 [Canna indica]|uniref:COBRA-like protein 10 n=1 Tax=Canna indica TaxID=4628 RepID=A0AAQ3K7P8_9LILI|nr:COBRA-like protein 10 [Canna indica]
MPPSRALLVAVFFFSVLIHINVQAQDYDDAPEDSGYHPKAEDNCNGVFLTYTFGSRTKEFPHVKNASAQSWAFKSQATVLNAMAEDLKAWKMFIGFQHDEILVSASGAVIIDGTDYPARVGNGTTLAGYPQADLLNAIETAGDMSQIMVSIQMTGTQFGVKNPGVPMPKTIKLVNEGFECPAPTRQQTHMYVCCVKSKKKKKEKATEGKYLPRQYGDLTISYDVIQAYQTNYMAQVTIDIHHPLGRLDNWNLTWEWKRGEFIYSMKGAYTLKRDYAGCLYSDAGKYYRDLDFSPVMSCEKKPTIVDLPPERADDEQIGRIPNCCKNGTLLPPTMDSSKSKSMFQLQVYKMQPDLNRTALYPPANFKINGYLNPTYKCGPPIRVSPTEYSDPSGLMDKSYAMATWQVACNITRPEPKKSGCCVSFSAFFNDSVVPCSTCACGCPDDDETTCNANAPAMLLPPEALLIPAENRTAKAKAWAKIKHKRVPSLMPCWDHCGVSINWHIMSDYRTGWTARITVFNWRDYTFKNWFAAIRIPKAYQGYENVYSFNGTKLADNNTIFFQGLPYLNYLMPETDGKNPDEDPKVPGKQQSVISFKKKLTPGINVVGGDGFPTRVFFDGEECALPHMIPRSADGHRTRVGMMAAVMVFALLMMDNI